MTTAVAADRAALEVPAPFGSYSYRHRREFISTNIVGTLNVLEAARHAGITRPVQVSSSEVYGTPHDVLVAETAPLNAQSPYAASKVGADQLALSYQVSSTCPSSSRGLQHLRPTAVRPCRDPDDHHRSLTKNEIVLGSTAPTRDFLYVEDTVSGLMRCGEADGVEGNVINLGTGTEISVGDIAKLILKQLEIDKPIRFADERVRPARSEVQRLGADIAKARALLDWGPSVPLAEGLRRTIEWFKNSVVAYKPSIYNL